MWPTALTWCTCEITTEKKNTFLFHISPPCKSAHVGSHCSVWRSYKDFRAFYRHSLVCNLKCSLPFHLRLTTLHIVIVINYLMYSSELKSHIYNKMHIKHVRARWSKLSSPDVCAHENLDVRTSLEGTFHFKPRYIYFLPDKLTESECSFPSSALHPFLFEYCMNTSLVWVFFFYAIKIQDVVSHDVENAHFDSSGSKNTFLDLTKWIAWLRLH